MSVNPAQLKPREVLQAQVASFAHEATAEDETRGKLLDRIAHITVNGTADLIDVKSPKSTDNHTSKSGLDKDYAEYLKSVGGFSHDGIIGRARLIQDYSQFAPSIKSLKAELSSMDEPFKHDSHVGSGGNISVYSIEQAGKKYVVRGVDWNKSSPDLVDSRVAGGILAKGIKGFEQFVAASYEEGVVVSEYAPGKQMLELSLDDAKHITDEQLGDLVDGVIEFSKRGGGMDPKPSNLLYDADEGFTVIDVFSGRDASRGEHLKPSLASNLGYTVHAINAAAGRISEDLLSSRTPENFELDYETKVFQDGLVDRLIRQIEVRISKEDREEVIAKIKLSRRQSESRPKDQAISEYQTLLDKALGSQQ